MKVKYIGKVELHTTDGVVYTKGKIYDVTVEVFNNFKARFELVAEPKVEPEAKPTQRRKPKTKPSED